MIIQLDVPEAARKSVLRYYGVERADKSIQDKLLTTFVSVAMFDRLGEETDYHKTVG